MNKSISVCGTDCAKCYCFEQKMCGGCNECSGKVFHCADGQECNIYHCCVTKNNYSSCLECKEIPCAIWKKTRDPKFTDEEFEKNIAERIAVLKNESTIL